MPTKARFETPDGAAIKGNGGEEPLARCAGLLPGLVSDSNKNRQQEEKDDFGTPEQETPQRQVLENNETLPMQSKIRGGKEAQIAANAVEAANRNRWLSEAISKQNLGNGYQADSSANDDAPESSGSDPSAQPTPGALETNNPISEFRPLWFEGSLFLIRRGMTIRTFAQGSLVNDEALQEILLQEALRLLPNASLHKPVTGSDDSLILASFPLQLSAAVWKSMFRITGRASRNPSAEGSSDRFTNQQSKRPKPNQALASASPFPNASLAQWEAPCPAQNERTAVPELCLFSIYPVRLIPNPESAEGFSSQPQRIDGTRAV